MSSGDWTQSAIQRMRDVMKPTGNTHRGLDSIDKGGPLEHDVRLNRGASARWPATDETAHGADGDATFQQAYNNTADWKSDLGIT